MKKQSDLGAAERISLMPRSGIREIMDLAWSMKNVNHLEVGEPNFPTPKWIADAGISAIKLPATRVKLSSALGLLRHYSSH